jgi:hypothetical protein
MILYIMKRNISVMMITVVPVVQAQVYVSVIVV